MNKPEEDAHFVKCNVGDIYVIFLRIFLLNPLPHNGSASNWKTRTFPFRKNAGPLVVKLYRRELFQQLQTWKCTLCLALFQRIMYGSLVNSHIICAYF